MSVAIAALVLLAPGVAQGMTEIGAVEEPVPVRVVPINGPHDLGRSPTNGFGGGRGHLGQDMFAACGTPVVASQGGKIRKAGYHPVGGNFIVLTEKDTGLDAVYMHLAHRPRLHTHETVETDQRIGSVGDTGNADLRKLTEWALPIQERHLQEALDGSLKLAADEDPDEEE